MHGHSNVKQIKVLGMTFLPFLLPIYDDVSWHARNNFTERPFYVGIYYWTKQINSSDINFTSPVLRCLLYWVTVMWPVIFHPHPGARLLASGIGDQVTCGKADCVSVSGYLHLPYVFVHIPCINCCKFYISINVGQFHLHAKGIKM